MLFCGFLSGPGLNQVTSTFWSVTQSLHGGEHATIPHMEEDSQSFHMIPNAQIFISEITLIRANYTFICVAPRRSRPLIRDLRGSLDLNCAACARRSKWKPVLAAHLGLATPNRYIAHHKFARCGRG